MKNNWWTTEGLLSPWGFGSVFMDDPLPPTPTPDPKLGTPPPTPDPEPGTPPPTPTPEPKPGTEKKYTQADLDKAKEDERVRLQAEADRQKAIDEGNWKKVAEDEKKEREKLEAQIAESKDKELRTKVCTDEKIPVTWAERLKGKTEAEYRLDAKDIKKELGTRKAPDTEGGTHERGRQGDHPNPVPPPDVPNSRYQAM